MISKIIQKEKERQKSHLQGCRVVIKDEGVIFYCGDEDNYCDECYRRFNEHKQSLINLKEYMEEDLRKWKIVEETLDTTLAGEMINTCQAELLMGSSNHVDKLKEDIKELNKMIGKYG